jgi:hypothetical protein
MHFGSHSHRISAFTQPFSISSAQSRIRDNRTSKLSLQVIIEPPTVDQYLISQSLELIPQSSLFNQHPLLRKHHTLFLQKLQLTLLILSRRRIFPITFETPKVLSHQSAFAFTLNEQMTYTTTSNTSMTRHFRCKWIIPQCSTNGSWT